MNLIIIPFHDWRKSEKEGFRTRDVHFISSLSKNTSIDKIIIVNRPSTWLEFLYKKQKKSLKGSVILRKGPFSLTKVAPNIYITDYFSKDVIGQIWKKHLWFIERYNDSHYIDFIEKSCNILEIQQYNVISQNIFSYKLFTNLKADKKLFDAWDNFLKFPTYLKIKQALEEGYRYMAKEAIAWSTNSIENIEFFKSKFNPKKIHLIKNGVKSDFIRREGQMPQDLKSIQKPIIGFGGKISYLLDYDLINYATKDNPDKSFVFVGQILDKKVFNKIEKRSNVFFLGDKHYSEYANYVQNFDLCIIPYNINEGQHGGDSIKAYEYLLTGKKVVGTKGNGLLDLHEHLYLVDDAIAFSSELKTFDNQKSPIDINKHSWDSKSSLIVKILND